MTIARKRILVVEDDPAINTIITEFLRDEGYTAVSVTSGTEALRLLETEHFNLVTLDLGLPDMSGNDLLRHLEQGELALRCANLPILVISANIQTLKHNSHVKGAVPKPFNLNDLINSVHKLVS